MNLKHLYIDLDKTLLPYDSFPLFLPAFLNQLGLKGWANGLSIAFWAISGQRPKIRPALANILHNKKIEKYDQYCENWTKHRLVKDIRTNLLPPFSFSLASMSMDLIVDPLAILLGASQPSLSTQLGRESGLYTGKLSSPQCGGKGKAEMILNDAQNRGLNRSEVGLLTDHHRDIPALDVVDFPLLVNPTTPLLEWNQTHSAPVFNADETPDWKKIRCTPTR